MKYLWCFWAILLAFCTSESPDADPAPNFIYILADDLGYGDLGCYGQRYFHTPNIDALAAGGMRFTQHYSGSTVCAPSRSSLMTGLHTGHTYIRGNREVKPEGQHPLADSIYTLAEALRDAGYATGAFGKWGLGPPGSEGDPLNQGFDRFFGYNCQRMGHHYYPHHLWSDQDSIALEENRGSATGLYAPELIHDQTLQFIEAHQDEPFFLFVPSIIPHAELAAPERHHAKFRGKFLPEKIYYGTDDGPDFRRGPYQSQEECHAAFAGMVSLLDEQVGEIVAKVEELGLAGQTLIIFTSDNGPHLEGGADPDYFDSNGPLRGYKRDLFEGGIRVPMIASWPGTIAPATTSDHISAFWDVLPTLAELADIKVGSNDGISFVPTLKLQGRQQTHSHLYWEFHELGGRQAIRAGDWKLVGYDVFDSSKSEYHLYDLKNDLSETQDLSAEFPVLADSLRQLMAASRNSSEIFPFGSFP